jgi:hypothetical protein
MESLLISSCNQPFETTKFKKEASNNQLIDVNFVELHELQDKNADLEGIS